MSNGINPASIVRKILLVIQNKRIKPDINVSLQYTSRWSPWYTSVRHTL